MRIPGLGIWGRIVLEEEQEPPSYSEPGALGAQIPYMGKWGVGGGSCRITLISVKATLLKTWSFYF